MDMKEKDIIMHAIESLDITDETKKRVIAMLLLLDFDEKRTLSMLINATGKALAMDELDKELDKSEKKMSLEYIEYLLDELDYSKRVREELKKLTTKYNEELEDARDKMALEFYYKITK